MSEATRDNMAAPHKERFGAALVRTWSSGSFWNDVIVMVAAFILALIVGAILMIVASPDVLAKFSYFFSQPSAAFGACWTKVATAYGSLFSGAVGGWSSLAETSAQAAPLICAGLGIALSFRVGLFNIGGQGQAIWGAIFAAFVGFHYHLPMWIHLPMVVIVGLLAGALWGGLAGFLRAQFGVNEVISTIMLNYVAIKALVWLLNLKVFQRPGGAPISPPVDPSATLPNAGDSRLHLGFLLALIAAVAVWWLLERTKLGFQIRAVGANPEAAATAGMNVAVVFTLVMLLSGLLCGLGGVIHVTAPTISGVTSPLNTDGVSTLGFDAITVALLGRSKPLGTVLAGLLFGALQAGGSQMQGHAQTPIDLVSVLQAVMVMFVAAPMFVRALLPFLKERKAVAVPEPVAVSVQGGAA